MEVLKVLMSLWNYRLLFLNAVSLEIPKNGRNIDVFWQILGDLLAGDPRNVLELAGARATIAVIAVAIVAFLVRRLKPIAADRGATLRTGAGSCIAAQVATIERLVVLVVALLVALGDSVTAGRLGARLPGR